MASPVFRDYGNNLELIKQQPEGSDAHSLTGKIAYRVAIIDGLVFKSHGPLADWSKAQQTLAFWTSEGQKWACGMEIPGSVHSYLEGRAYAHYLARQRDGMGGDQETDWRRALDSVGEEVIHDVYGRLGVGLPGRIELPASTG